MKIRYYVIDDSPLEGYGQATEYDSPEAAMAAVDDNIERFAESSVIGVCEYERDCNGENEDEFTGRFWEKDNVCGGTWREFK